MPRAERNTDWIALGAVLAVAVLWRALFFLALRDTPLAAWHTWDQSDMHSFWLQARALAAGDWLARAPYHPYHEWMRVAPPEAWQAFFTRPAFYQAPLYSYFLALLMRLGGDAALHARLIQLALGVANAGLVYAVTRRLFGRGAGVAAGLLAAVYGPLLVIESQLLRDTLVLSLMLSVIYFYQSWARLAGQCLKAGREAAPRRAEIKNYPKNMAIDALVIGVLMGVLAMAHEGAALLGTAVLLAGWARLRRAGGRVAWRWAAWLALGGLIGYAPLLARNLAVGAPPLPRFAGSAFAWAVANHATAGWGGATWIVPTPAFGETLRASGGSVPALVTGVLDSYHGQWWRWLGHWVQRLAALGIGAENNENVCQVFFARRVPILAFTVDFRLLLPLALAGAAAWGWRRWSAALRRGTPAMALALDGVLVALMLSLVLPLGRYRLMLLPALLPFAGRMLFVIWALLMPSSGTPGSDKKAGIDSAFRIPHSAFSRPRRLALAAGLVALVALGQWGLGRVLPFGGLRPTDFKIAAKILLDWGRPDLARRELREGIDAGFPAGQFDLELGITADMMGVAAAARGDFPTACVEAERALAAARRAGRVEMARQVEARLARYRQGRPAVM